MRNSPGPLTLCRLPARRMTNFCQALATLRESVIRTAISTRGAPAQGLTTRPTMIPARAAIVVKHKVIGFMLLIIAASAVARWAARKGVPAGSWLGRMLARKPPMLGRVALANTMARIVWALLAKGGVYRAPVAAV